MYKITLFIVLFTTAISCQKSKNDQEKLSDKSDFSTIVLKVERGAFHNDSFVLMDTLITFYPENEMESTEYQAYYMISEEAISKFDRDQLIQKIVDANIWELQDKYTPDESCTSNLTVTISLDGKTKNIICDDFERGCPDIIKFIENKMVRLHGKGLKRIFLPG